MSRIILAGFFLWAWGLWHAAWLASLVVLAPLAGLGYVAPSVLLITWLVLYAVFLPLEIAGVLGNARHRDGRARTLSEFRQYIPVTHGKGGSMVGWNALGLLGLVDAVIVGWLAYQTYPLVGTVIAGALAGITSGVIALVLVPHFGVRHRVG